MKRDFFQSAIIVFVGVVLGGSFYFKPTININFITDLFHQKTPVLTEKKLEEGKDDDCWYSNDTIDANRLYRKLDDFYAELDGNVYIREDVGDNFHYYKKIEGADTKSFEVISFGENSAGFAKDKVRIYFYGNVTDVDVGSFSKIGEGYYGDKKTMYKIISGDGQNSLQKLDYDVPTFRFFNENGGEEQYTIDKNGLYFNDTFLPGVDPEQFTTVTDFTENDNRYVRGEYGHGYRPLWRYYTRDLSHIIYQGSILYRADFDTFEPIYTGPYMEEYAKDADHVYYQASVIPGADPDSFIAFTDQPYEGCITAKYAIDDHAVYFEEHVVPLADPHSFESLYFGYGKDKNHVFKDGLLQVGLDLENFTKKCEYGNEPTDDKAGMITDGASNDQDNFSDETYSEDVRFPPNEASPIVYSEGFGAGWRFSPVDVQTDLYSYLNFGGPTIHADFSASSSELLFITNEFDTTGFDTLSFIAGGESQTTGKEFSIRIINSNGSSTERKLAGYTKYGRFLQGQMGDVHIPLKDLHAENSVINTISIISSSAVPLIIMKVAFERRLD